MLRFISGLILGIVVGGVLVFALTSLEVKTLRGIPVNEKSTPTTAYYPTPAIISMTPVPLSQVKSNIDATEEALATSAAVQGSAQRSAHATGSAACVSAEIQIDPRSTRRPVVIDRPTIWEPTASGDQATIIPLGTVVLLNRGQLAVLLIAVRAYSTISMSRDTQWTCSFSRARSLFFPRHQSGRRLSTDSYQRCARPIRAGTRAM